MITPRILPLLLLPFCLSAQVPDWKPVEKPWDRGLGSHRVVVRVEGAGDVAEARIPWRRRDLAPERKAVLIHGLTSGKPVSNLHARRVDAEQGDLWFQPTPGETDYAVYFLPVRVTGGNFPSSQYLPPEAKADPAWLARAEAGPRLEARVARWEAVSAMDAWTDMEVIATAAETRALAEGPGGPLRAAFLDASKSARMFDRLPAALANPTRWQTPASLAVRTGGVAMFQVLVWAPSVDLTGVRVTTAPANARFTCLTTDGVDWHGKPFQRAVDVAVGKVQPFWCMLEADAPAPLGKQSVTLDISAKGVPSRRMEVTLDVRAEPVPGREDGDPQSLTRLRWLNSATAADDEPAKGYPPLEVNGTTITCLGRAVELGADGLPARITSHFNRAVTRVLPAPSLSLLSEPMRLEAVAADGAPVPLASSAFTFTRVTPGVVEWKSDWQGAGLRAALTGRMEFDGSLAYRVALEAVGGTRALADVRLVAARTPESSRQVLGLQLEAGDNPAAWDWKWDVKERNQDSVWIGSVNGGLRVLLKAENYARPGVNIHYARRPLNDPPSWSGGGVGGMSWKDHRLSCFSGPRALEPGRPLRFDFDLLVTPFHPLRTEQQWSERYFHTSGVPRDYAKYLDNARDATANVVNIHQGNWLNPYINYPFLTWDRLRDFARAAHDRGLRAKFYYTVRELSNWTPELFALRSLGDEVLLHGKGGGHPWAEEHLGGDYWQAWYEGGVQDVSILTQPMSRFHNYYVEGLRWLCENAGCDGIYLDDIAYDRSIMLRARKVLDRFCPRGGLIDLHSWNEFHAWPKWAHCANIFMDSLPFVDRLWFGEGHHYSGPPAEHFLVEISGIPFGLMGEMLEGGGNPGLGLVFGCTGRLGWGGSPRSVWKLWDDFGARDAEFIGWWAGEDCPVRCANPAVKATVWRKPGETLLAVANFSGSSVRAALEIDWAALGLDPARVKLYAPEMPELKQREALFDPGQPVVLKGHAGAVFRVDAVKRDIAARDAAKGPGAVIFEDTFVPAPDAGWKTVVSPRAVNAIRSDAGLVIQAPANLHAYVERALPANAGAVSARVWQDGADEGQQWGPGFALVWADGRTLKVSVRKDGRITVSPNGRDDMPAQIATRAPLDLTVQWEKDAVRVVAAGAAMGGLDEEIAVFPRREFPGAPTLLRAGKMPNTAKPQDHGDPGPTGFNRIEWLRVHAE